MHRRGSNDSEKKHVAYGRVSDYSVRRTSGAPKLSVIRRCILNQILNFHD